MGKQLEKIYKGDSRNIGSWYRNYGGQTYKRLSYYPTRERAEEKAEEIKKKGLIKGYVVSEKQQGVYYLFVR